MDSRFLRGNNSNNNNTGRDGGGRGLPPLSSLQHSSSTVYHNNHCHSHGHHIHHHHQQQQQQQFLLPPPPALHHRLSVPSLPPPLDHTSRRWSTPIHSSSSSSSASAGALDHNDYASAILAYRQRVNNLHYPSSSAINLPHPLLAPGRHNQSLWPDRSSSSSHPHPHPLFSEASASAPHYGSAPSNSRFSTLSETIKADKEEGYGKETSVSFRYLKQSNARSPEEASASRSHATSSRHIPSSSSPSSLGRDHYYLYRELSNDREEMRSLSGLDSSRQSAAISAKIFLDEKRSSSFRSSLQIREGSGSEAHEPVDLSHRGYGDQASNEIPLSYASSSLARNSPQVTPLDKGTGSRKRMRGNEEKYTFERDNHKAYSARQRRFSCDPGLAVLPRTPESFRNLPIVRRVLSSGRFAQGKEGKEMHRNEYVRHLARSPASLYGSSPSKSSKKKRSSWKKSVASEGNHLLSSLLANSVKSRGKEPEKRCTMEAKDSPQKSFQNPRNNKTKNRSPAIENDHDRLLTENDCDRPLMNIMPDGGVVASVRRTSGGRGTLSSKDEQWSDDWTPKKSASRLYKSVGKALKIVEASPRTKSVKSRVVRLISSDVKLCGDSNPSENQEEEHEIVQEDSKTITGLQDSGTNPPISSTPIPILSSHKNLGQDANSLGAKIKNKRHLAKDLCQERGLMEVAIIASPEMESPGPKFSTPSSERRRIFGSDPPNNITVHQSASHQRVCNKDDECLFNSETPLHAMSGELIPPLNLNLSSENYSDIQISGTIAPLTETSAQQKLQVGEVTKSLERNNTDDLRNFLPVNSVKDINLLNLKSTDLNSECEVFSSALAHRVVTPISTLQKELRNDFDSPVSELFKTLENREMLEEIEMVELIQQKTDRKAEQEVRLFGKSLMTSTVNAKPIIGSSMITGSSGAKICITDSTSENTGNSVLTISEADYTQKNNLFMLLGGTSSVEHIGNISKLQTPALGLICEQQDDRGALLKTMMNACVEDVMTKPMFPAGTSDFEHERALNRLPDNFMEERTNVSSHALPSPAINLSAKGKGSPTVPASDVLEMMRHDGHVDIDSKNVSSTAMEDFKLDEIITKSNITAPSSTLWASNSEEIITLMSDKVTETTTGTTVNVNKQESLSNVSLKEPNIVIEVVSPVMETSKEANLGKSEVNLQEKLEANLPEKAGSNILVEVASHSTSKKFSVPLMQSHGRVQNKLIRAGARTWYRSTNSVVQPIPKMPKPAAVTTSPLPAPTQRLADVASAYVRKGNSLVRASSTAGLMVPLTGKEVAGKVFPNVRRQPQNHLIFRNMMKNVKPAFRQVFTAQKSSTNNTKSSSPSIEKNLAVPTALDGSQDSQGVGPLCSSEKLMASGKFEGHSNNSVFGILVDDQEPKRLFTSEANDRMQNATLQLKTVPLNVQSAVDPKKSDMPVTYYASNKANQLVASIPFISPVFTGEAKTVTVSGTTHDVYYKRKGNQLVRNDGGEKDKILQDQVSRRLKGTMRHSAARQALRKRSYLPHPSVWMRKAEEEHVNSVLPLLFPWKRQVRGHHVRAGRRKALPRAKKGSLLFIISKKLQHLRKVQPVYSRSADGFSLHRSGLLGLSGANLKWTKSIEKRSKQASKEATKAVAAVEKQRREKKEAETGANNIIAKTNTQKRETRPSPYRRDRIIMVGLVRYKMDPSRRTLQRLPDQWSGDGVEASSLKNRACSAILSTPRRLSFDGTQYVRVGNGNKLIRDPKAVARALANDKVRWSLHTARSRRAKKQQYCLFFTRFGKCNKKEGECPYIHDPEKVAVCTKFLKGTCTGVNCLFSHKVIPERMPDCSFFLEGMCTNEGCPYRHVYVNPKAPICEGFLKGFCLDGDECNKKHTTVCPSFAARGECHNKTTCKLHHPKKNGKRATTSNIGKLKAKKRRYFVAGNDGLHGLREASDGQESGDAYDSCSNESPDFIMVPDVAVDFDEAAEFQRKFASIKEHHPFLRECSLEDIDMWITPVLLLGKAIST